MKLKRPLLFFDLETTGLDVMEDRIVQIAAIKYGQKKTQKINYFVNPQIPIPEQATEVHGISDEDVKGKPTFGRLSKELFHFFSDCDWAGYNIVNFDIPILINEFDRWDYYFNEYPAIIDIYQIFIKQVPHSLSSAVNYYLNRDIVNAHNALGDVKETINVFGAQLKKGDIPKDIYELSDFLKKEGQLDLGGKLIEVAGIITIAFGKYKDYPVEEVPESYFTWCKKNNVFGRDAWSIINRALNQARKIER